MSGPITSPTPDPSNAERLREFHRAIGLSLPTRPTVPPADVLALRRTLIAEEAAEVDHEFAALESRELNSTDLAPTKLTPTELTPLDLAPLAHELADLLYVTYGAFVTLGIDADAVFAAVHRANMNKTTGPKRADGKQLKPPGWQGADIRAVLERLGGTTD